MNSVYIHLSEDFALKRQIEPHKTLLLTTRAVEVFLENMGKSLADYDLQQFYKDIDILVQRIRDIQDALDAPIVASYLGARALLTIEQRAAYKRTISHVKQSKPRLFFIDVPGGT